MMLPTEMKTGTGTASNSGIGESTPRDIAEPVPVFISPALTREQSRRVDELAQTEFGLCGLVLMENAGRGVADVLCRLGIAGPVVICCGKGNNAGDGFVIARHLDLRGHKVRVLLWAKPEKLAGDAATNFHILQKTDVPIELFGSDVSHDAARLVRHLDGAAWIVDALLGTGARGEPRPPLDAVIEQLNASAAPKLAVDLPSGLDCDAGAPAKATIIARETCTFATAKVGFSAPTAARYLGRVHVLDIGVPLRAIERAGHCSMQ
jgi:NAD(P)H-hydrate epimerase